VVQFGIGRSSLLAASIPILNGTDPDTAWQLLGHARGIAIPDTTKQRNWPTRLIEHRRA